MSIYEERNSGGCKNNSKVNDACLLGKGAEALSNHVEVGSG